MCSKEEPEQTPWLTKREWNSDPVSDQSNEKIMSDVSPKGTITYYFVGTLMVNFVSELFHVPSNCVQPKIGSRSM